MKLRTSGIVAVVLSVLAAQPALGAISIEIDRGYDNPKKIAVVPFARKQNIDGVENMASIVSGDLARSGQFAPTPSEDMLSLPSTPDEVSFRDWRVQGIEYLVIGQTEQDFKGDLVVRFMLYDVVSQRRLTSERLAAPLDSARSVGHLISDIVYEELTGVRGAFSTKLLYVVAEDLGTTEARFYLEMADVDGKRPVRLLESREPILSASWSGDGKQVAYVSFERRKPTIFLHEIATGQRTVLTDFRGLNSAPVFSPDNERIALVLSRDGNSEIYVMDLATKELERVTRHPSIDTEPSWAPDGESLIFTSDRGGKPQIYRVELATGLTDRLTFQGDYNASGELLPDGRHLVFVHRRDGQFHIALLDIERDRLTVLTEASQDEAPSLAPNGTMLIYATQHRGRGILAVVSIDGRVKYRLPSSQGDVREPSWSPFMTEATTVQQ